MEEKETKKTKNEEQNNVEVQSFEKKNGIKEYRFTIILLVVIAVFVIFMPFISEKVQNLKDTNFFSNLFSKNNSNLENNDNNVPKDKPEKDKDTFISADKSGANAPVLKDGMIPVRYNTIEKKWVKADSSNPSTNSWYNYANGEWANAVLVKASGTKTRDYYLKSSNDTIINDEDILAFYVWIPRYKYSLVASTGVQQIDVVFEEKTATKSQGPNYITHPAFTFGNEELDGIWVGKFEVTGNINNLTILPNQMALVNQNIANMVNAIPGFYNDIYGLNQTTTDVHLMKNTEWGSIVYLMNSKYGICKDNKCTKPTTYSYDYSSDIGIKSSTTGNINGVYAMNGSVMEYVMGNNNGVVGASGLDTVWMNENKKYYDLYTDGVEADLTRGINGDATTEFGPFQSEQSSWDNSTAKFVNSANPWFFRDVNSDMYSFSSYTGGAHYQVGFRLTLV